MDSNPVVAAIQVWLNGKKRHVIDVAFSVVDLFVSPVGDQQGYVPFEGGLRIT